MLGGRCTDGFSLAVTTTRYEICTYDLFLGAAPKVIDHIGETIQIVNSGTDLAGCFYTDIGPLNQIIAIWAYGAGAVADPGSNEIRASTSWPKEISSLVRSSTREVYLPRIYSPDLTPGRHGPCYEMRTYQLMPGALKADQALWETALAKRQEYSPLSCVMDCELGTSNKLVHIWPYRDPSHRHEIRTRVVKDGVWPPKGQPGAPPTVYTQENKLMYPTSFSPMQ